MPPRFFNIHNDNERIFDSCGYGGLYPMYLVADIGGSNARFGLLRNQTGNVTECETLQTCGFPSFIDAVAHYLELCGSPRVTAAAIAIANPVVGDLIQMTNHHWSFSIEQVRRHFQFDRLIVLNDFTALALSLPRLSANELRQIGGNIPIEKSPLALIGPGTGLGACALIPNGEGGWMALAGEGGHVTAAAADDYEAEIIAFCRREFGHVSAERLLSGMGLCNLHRAVMEISSKSATKLMPAEITERALSGEDSDCEKVLDIFCSFLGTAARNLALTIGARGGVYIGGGLVPRFSDYFQRSKFRVRFEGKDRMSTYLTPIPVYVIHAKNPALIGAAISLDTQLGFLREGV
jgi:glucokinase